MKKGANSSAANAAKQAPACSPAFLNKFKGEVEY